MLQLIKDLSKKLPYPVFLWLFYLWYRTSELPRKQRLRRKLGVPLLETADFEVCKTCDTVCLLGSGASINRIPAERWQGIARHDTIGFNFWLFHPFVPRMYFFEALGRNDSPEMRDAYQSIASQRAAEYMQCLKVASNLIEDFVCPPEWRSQIYTFADIPVPATNFDDFRYGLERLWRKGTFNPEKGIHHLFKQASTLSFLLSFAVIMGYKRIVLCGIDLAHAEYFFQDPELYPESCKLEFMPRHGAHKTNIPMPWNVPAVEVVLAMKEIILDRRGIEIYVENKNSALWPRIAEAPDSIFQRN